MYSKFKISFQGATTELPTPHTPSSLTPSPTSMGAIGPQLSSPDVLQNGIPDQMAVGLEPPHLTGNHSVGHVAGHPDDGTHMPVQPMNHADVVHSNHPSPEIMHHQNHTSPHHYSNHPSPEIMHHHSNHPSPEVMHHHGDPSAHMPNGHPGSPCALSRSPTYSPVGEVYKYPPSHHFKREMV